MHYEGWIETTLGEILTLEYGANLPETSRTREGFSVYGSNGMVGKHKDYLVEEPGIIVGRKGTVGAVVWSPDSFWPIDTTYYVKLRANISLKFIYWYLNYLPLRSLDSSTGVPGLNRNDVYRLVVKIPCQPDEQHRIVEILDTIDEAIAHTEALIAKLKQIRAGLLHDLLTRGLDEEGRLRDEIAHPEYFKDSPSGRIPKDWEIHPVGEVFDMQLGKMLSRASKKGFSPFPYLANRNVQWDEVDISDLEWMDFNNAEREKFSLLPDDLVVCEGGESGRTAMWRGEMENCYFQKAIHRLRPKDLRVLPGYMLRFMYRAVNYGLLTSFTSQTSITHLTQEKFALLPLSLPPLEEQQAIVDVFDSYDTRIRTEEAYLNKLKQQKKGLMHDLLTGRVRVGRMAISPYEN